MREMISGFLLRKKLPAVPIRDDSRQHFMVQASS